MAKFRMYGNQNEQTFVIFIVLSVLSFITIAVARDCCPENAYMESKMCSDNITSFDLNCPKGSMFLDYILSKEEKLSMKPDENFDVFEEGTLPEDKFCIGKIQRNGTDRLVALICFDEEEPSLFDIILRILMAFSTLLLLVTFYVYIVLPNLKDVQDKCVIAFVGCLASFYITLLVTQTFPTSSDVLCVVQAFTLYFFLSATFFWNNIVSFNIWKSVRNASHKIKQKSLFIIYLLWGFGVPALMMTISLILDQVPGGNHVRPRLGEVKCWFKGKLETWLYFYGPISILLLLNAFMFLQCVWIICKRQKLTNDSKLRSTRFKYMMYLKLYLIMGITWTFEVISFSASSEGNMKYFWFFTDCLNSAQGILIFIILVVYRKKVRRGVLQSELLRINWPKSWANEEIQESSAASLVEEFELPNQKSKMIVESQN